MNVVCLTGPGVSGNSVVSRISSATDVALHVVEAPRGIRTAVVRKYRSRGWAGVADAALARFYDGRPHSREDVYDRWFQDSWRTPPPVPQLVVPSINDASVRQALLDLGQVVLVVEAASVVGEHILDVCERTLGVHWGLSPYYRGTRCTEWALLHWDVRNIGVTVHELSMTIDGGAIIGQRRAAIARTDTVFSLNMQLTALGTEIVVEALGLLGRNLDYARMPQDLSRGFGLFSRHWSALLSRHVARLERRGLEAVIASPSREALPIVELRAV